jgi:hypothetical protein
MTFWFGFGSVDLCLSLTDPDSDRDPSIFIIDVQGKTIWCERQKSNLVTHGSRNYKARNRCPDRVHLKKRIGSVKLTEKPESLKKANKTGNQCGGSGMFIPDPGS